MPVPERPRHAGTKLCSIRLWLASVQRVAHAAADGVVAHDIAVGPDGEIYATALSARIVVLHHVVVGVLAETDLCLAVRDAIAVRSLQVEPQHPYALDVAVGRVSELEGVAVEAAVGRDGHAASANDADGLMPVGADLVVA
jgi:hypothetical protein